MSGLAQLVHTFLRRRVWTEERTRQEIEDRVRRASSEYCNKSPEFSAHSPNIPIPKGKDRRFPQYKEQASIITSISSVGLKTPGNYLLTPLNGLSETSCCLTFE